MFAFFSVFTHTPLDIEQASTHIPQNQWIKSTVQLAALHVPNSVANVAAEPVFAASHARVATGTGR